jgi:hypothetical protein
MSPIRRFDWKARRKMRMPLAVPHRLPRLSTRLIGRRTGAGGRNDSKLRNLASFIPAAAAAKKLTTILIKTSGVRSDEKILRKDRHLIISMKLLEVTGDEGCNGEAFECALLVMHVQL